MFSVNGFSAVDQDKLSYEKGVEFFDYMKTQKKSISKILTSVDSLDNAHFVSTKAYSDFLIYVEERLSTDYGPEIIDFTFKISEFFQLNNMQQNAYIYLNKTIRLVELYPEKASHISLARLYEDLGLSYYYFKRLEIAKEWFFKAIKQKDVSPSSEINIFNTLGMIHRERMQIDSSKFYFEKALLLAKKNNRRDWIGIISGNLGHYYLLKHDYVNARKLVQKDLEISLETNNSASALYAQGLLVEMDLKQENLADAIAGLENARKILELDGSIGTKTYFYKVQSLCLEKQGKFAESLKSYQNYIAYRDTASKQLNLENFNNIEFQLGYAKKQAEIAVLKEKKEKDEWIIITLFAFLGTVVIAFTMIVYQVVKRKKRDKEIMYLQQLRVEEELKNTEKQVHEILHNLSEKNQLIEELNGEIESIQEKQQNQDNQIETNKLSERLQSFVLLTEDDWIVFKKLFEKLNPGFFDYFTMNYPDLTNAEIRLAALIKLNLSNIEMARTLGISIDSVRKTNLRLRKRLNIDEQADLLKLIVSV